MLEIDPSKFKTPPFKHQLDGVRFLIKQPHAALFDEPGAGKSKQIVDAGCIMFEGAVIDTILIVCPSAVKVVWKDLDEGEIVKHGWVSGYVGEYNARNPKLLDHERARRDGRLYWIITNYEFLRSKDRLHNLCRQLRGRRVWLVCDESSFIKSPTAAQSKACHELSKYAIRRTLLNGTPVTHSPLDLFSQFWTLNPKILNADNYFQFRNRHAVMGGYLKKQIVKFVRLDLLRKQTAPYVLRRLKSDCLDLPPKMPPVNVEVPLDAETWRLYREMRDFMVTWLDAEERVMTQHAVVKLMRLAQLASGIVGGIEPQSEDSANDAREISSEKRNWLLEWFEERVSSDPNFRVVAWCRFRKEQECLVDAVKGKWPYGRIIGGQKKDDREKVLREFVSGDGPYILIGQPQAGGWGLNLQHKCSNMVYLSSDYNLLTRLQSEDRLHRPGQMFPVNYYDVLATGPNGERTIDHTMRKALHRKEDLATWTTARWRKSLEEEIAA